MLLSIVVPARSLARVPGPKGVHAAYAVVHGAFDTPWTGGPLFPDKPEEFFDRPEETAEEVYHVAHQVRSQSGHCHG